MSIHDEINAGISAHGAWKEKLLKAIETGESEVAPNVVKTDHNCAFGQWLHKDIDSDAKNSPHYKDIVDLHAQFHQEAGSILELAINGSKDKADELMGSDGKFATLSANLTDKMNEWKESQ